MFFRHQKEQKADKLSKVPKDLLLYNVAPCLTIADTVNLKRVSKLFANPKLLNPEIPLHQLKLKQCQLYNEIENKLKISLLAKINNPFRRGAKAVPDEKKVRHMVHRILYSINNPFIKSYYYLPKKINRPTAEEKTNCYPFSEFYNFFSDDELIIEFKILARNLLFYLTMYLFSYAINRNETSARLQENILNVPTLNFIFILSLIGTYIGSGKWLSKSAQTSFLSTALGDRHQDISELAFQYEKLSLILNKLEAIKTRTKEEKDGYRLPQLQPY